MAEVTAEKQPPPAQPETIAGLGQALDRVRAAQVPDEPFDPAGAWAQAYAVVATDNGAVVGRLALSRRPIGADAGVLSVEWVKGAGAPPASHWRLNGTIGTRGDGLAAAETWRVTGRRHAGRFDAPGDAVAGTDIARSGEAVAGRVSIVDGAGPRRTEDATAPVAVNWQLFDAVQRLPRDAGFTQDFVLVDQFDLVKPGQRLSYRGAVEAPVGGRPRRLHGFDHVGFGTVPWVYWVEEASGRLVAAVSGLEAYVLGALPPGGGRDRGEAKRKQAAY